MIHSKCIQVLIGCDSNFKLPALLFEDSTSVGHPGNDIVKLAKTGLIPAATHNYNYIFHVINDNCIFLELVNIWNWKRIVQKPKMMTN